MTAITLEELTFAIAASWSAETQYARPDDDADTGRYDPSRNQCGTTALVVQDWLGGDLLVADVVVGEQTKGVHYWNRLPDGREVDLTRQQFVDGESVGPPEVARPRPPTLPSDVAEPYLLLSRRVRSLLETGCALADRLPGTGIVGAK